MPDPTTTTPDTTTSDVGGLVPEPLARPGRFGPFGGRYVPEALIPALEQLDEARQKAAVDPEFVDELARLHRTYTGRPSIITEVPRFAAHCGGARVILKREDLNHTGSHKINNVLAQALLTKRMGKTRVIAETGAGQHGVATATAAALMGLECRIYMGKVDTERQALNVARMKILGAEVVPVEHGSATLKDAINEALRDWVTNVGTTHYLIGTVTGPHPFPEMVRDFHKLIGEEAREQVLELTGRLPSAVIACVGGGSNAMGIFHRFVPDAGVRLIGIEAGGEGIESGRHAARFASTATPGVLHGAMSYLMQDADGQTVESHSISAGLDYPSVGPEHAWLRDSGRAEYRYATDDTVMEAFRLLSRTEGIIPAIESAHALVGAMEVGRELGPDALLLVNLSGRGDKDMETAADLLRAARGVRRDHHGARGRGGAAPLPRRGARRAGRLPAGRVPDRRGLARGDAGAGRGRLRRRRGGRALQRPADGRPGHPARRGHGPGRRQPGRRRLPRHGRGARRRRHPAGHDLLEPRAAPGGRALRRRPRGARRRRPDHARPHPRGGRRTGSPPATSTASTGSSSWRRRPPPSGSPR